MSCSFIFQIIVSAMSETKNCCSCEKPFVKQKTGYSRRACSAIASPRTLKKVFERDVEGYLCLACQSYVTSKTVHVKVNGRNRRSWPPEKISTPAASPRKRPIEALSPCGAVALGRKRVDNKRTPMKRTWTNLVHMSGAANGKNCRQRATVMMMHSHYRSAFRYNACFYFPT